jgi:hypothetical protein
MQYGVYRKYFNDTFINKVVVVGNRNLEII